MHFLTGMTNLLYHPNHSIRHHFLLLVLSYTLHQLLVLVHYLVQSQAHLVAQRRVVLLMSTVQQP